MGKVVMAELDGVRDADGLGGGVDDAETAVVMQCWTEVVAIAAAKGPGAALVGLGVDDDSTTNGAKWCGGVVKGLAVEKFPCGFGGVDGGLA